MNRAELREMRRELSRESRAYPAHLRKIPPAEWPVRVPVNVREVWRSREFLLQVYEERGMERLSICRTEINLEGSRWADDISWDDLQRLKRECGRGERDAVEVFPADCDVVNVANMRHLWIMPEPLAFKWRKP